MNELRGTRAKRLLEEGYSIGTAAKIAGVSQFWLSLLFKDRPKLEQKKAETR